MTTPNEALKRMLHTEAGRPQPVSSSSPSQMPVLGAFLTAAMASAGHSQEELASGLKMDPTLLEGILGGLLPDSELDDITLNELAQALELEADLLRTILGRNAQHEARRSAKA